MQTFTLTHLVVAVVAALILGVVIGSPRRRAPGESLMDTDFDSDWHGPRDPWEVQRTVMAASGQDLPDHPALTKGTLLYGALIMEEVGETLEALDRCLSEVLLGDQPLPPDHPEMLALWKVREQFASYAEVLQKDAKVVREHLAGVGKVYMPLSLEEAVPLLDGATDVVVVTCGLALASGLPGAEAYEEVGGSNLSKRNPDTGKIDKTLDGKWIKGRDYRAPNLQKVLGWHSSAA